jgi:hypothetical protein
MVEFVRFEDLEEFIASLRSMTDARNAFSPAERKFNVVHGSTQKRQGEISETTPSPTADP